MRLTPAVASVLSRFQRVRSGLVVGYGDDTMSVLKSHRDGVWMEIPLSDEFPFEDSQFEVIVMHGSGVCRERVREANRILMPEGCLFFTVNERMGNDDGYTAPELYKIVREGFDIIELKRPKWWRFGRDGKTMTVCARKKAWREHKGFIREGSLPFTPFRSRT
jgi:SAM-dependent methyltransferase